MVSGTCFHTQTAGVDRLGGSGHDRRDHQQRGVGGGRMADLQPKQTRDCRVTTPDPLWLTTSVSKAEPSILNGPFPTDILYRATPYQVARPDSLSYLGKEDLAMFIPDA